LIATASRLPLDQGLAEERAAFLALRGGDQARALRHLFFAERAVGPTGAVAEAEAPPIAAVAVVGGGTMGAGIAYALLSAGLAVTLLESDAQGVDRAAANVEKLIEAGLKRGAVTPDKATALRQALSVTSDYATAGQADLAIEAAFESMDVKKAVFAKLEQALPAETVLATNTSYLDIDVIAATLADPSRVLGLHFFAPAHVMKLLEIVRAEATSDRALALGFDLAKRLRKVPVLAGVCDGFIGNRILARYREAADGLVMDGALPSEVDSAMTAFGYAMGPYETQDLSGLDIGYANRRRQDATRDPQRRYVPIADRMVEEGRLGRKTGAGWYSYADDGKKAVDPLVEALVLEEAARAGVTRRSFAPEEIRHRLLHAMINEAADILYDGIAARAADIDLVTVHGYGFPRWRGGLMYYADSLGPKAVLAALQALAKEDPLLWRPSPLVESCAAKGMGFADWQR
jgi:3-hydroxyacyl-CoA dehydrogenase